MMIRDKRIDLLKGIAAYLVLCGHVIAYQINDSTFDNAMQQWICSFHMPFFALLSGYVLFFTYNKPIKKTVIQRSIMLSIPIFVWGTLNYFLNAIIHDSEISLLSYLFSICAVGLWFLFVIIFLNDIIVIIYRIIKNEILQIIVCCCVFAVCLLLCNFIHPMRMITYLFPYYYTGFLLNKYKEKLIKYKKQTLCFGAVLFSIFIMLFRRDTFIYTTRLSVVYSGKTILEQFDINVYRWITGFCGICLIWLIVDYINPKQGKVYDTLNDIGKYCLPIYAMQEFVFNLSREFIKPLLENAIFERIYHTTLIYSYIFAPLMGTLMALFFLFLAKRISKCRWLSLCLFGR